MNSGFKKIPILLSTIFFIVSFAVLILLYKEIDKTKKVTEEIEKKWASESERRKELQTLDKSLKFIISDKEELDRHFAQSGDIVPFLNTLERLAKDAGASAQVSSVDILKENQGLGVSLKAEGSFGSIYKLLQLFENSPYELEVVALDMQRVFSNETEGASTGTRWEGLFRLRLISFLQ